jgi:hypothetical protein
VIAALAVAMLAAALLGACGGSGSSADSTAATQGSGASAGGDSQQSGADRKRADNGSRQQRQDGVSADDQGSGGSDSGAVSTPLKVSGGGSEQFRTNGGDNSIQDFGDESGESELEEAAEALHSFYVARAEEGWSSACTYLAKSMAQQLEQLASQSPQLKDKGCAAVLHAFTRPLPASVRRETTVVDAGSLRTEGEQSFLIYYGEGHTPYAMPMVQEDGGWKVTLLSATPLG